MPINEFGYALKNCTMRWTKSARECYKNGLTCYKCDTLPEDLKPQCRMKPVVLELVRLYGRPCKGEKWEDIEN